MHSNQGANKGNGGKSGSTGERKSEPSPLKKSPAPARKTAPQKPTVKSPGPTRKTAAPSGKTTTTSKPSTSGSKQQTSNKGDKNTKTDSNKTSTGSEDKAKEPKKDLDKTAIGKSGITLVAGDTGPKGDTATTKGNPTFTSDNSNATNEPSLTDHSLSPMASKTVETSDIGPEPSPTGVPADGNSEIMSNEGVDKGIDTSPPKTASEIIQEAEERARSPAAGARSKSPSTDGRDRSSSAERRTRLPQVGSRGASPSAELREKSPPVEVRVKSPPLPATNGIHDQTISDSPTITNKSNPGKSENQLTLAPSSQPQGTGSTSTPPSPRLRQKAATPPPIPPKPTEIPVDPLRLKETDGKPGGDGVEALNSSKVDSTGNDLITGKIDAAKRRKEEPRPGTIARAKSALGQGDEDDKATAATVKKRPEIKRRNVQSAVKSRSTNGKGTASETSETDSSTEKFVSKLTEKKEEPGVPKSSSSKELSGTDSSDKPETFPRDNSSFNKDSKKDKTSTNATASQNNSSAQIPASSAGSSPNPARKSSTKMTKSSSEGAKLHELGNTPTVTKSNSSASKKSGTNLNKSKSESNPEVKPDSNTEEGSSDPANLGDPSVSSSGSFRNPETLASSRILSLAQKGEWNALDQILRGMEKGNTQELNASDKADNNLSPLLSGDEDTGVNTVMLAARENRLVIVERLLDLGANINDRTKDGRTVLHYAAGHAKDDLVKLLLNRKADATLPGGPKEQLPLHVACARPSGVLTIVQMLLRSSGKDCRTASDKDGNIPLFLAAESGNTAVCRELLQSNNEQQVRITKRDSGDTCLHIACRRKDFEMVKLFVENSAYVDARNEEGLTPLHISSYEGDETAVKYLHQCKANPNLIDKQDRSPLHIAAERGNTSIVEILVDKFKANVSARTKDGSTLMHIASQYGHPDTALAFLKKGVPLNMPNKAGALCLHVASEKGHVNVVKALLLKGAQVDAKTKDGYTALHIAVQYCKPMAVQTLLGFGAMVELKGGKAKETPLHIAARTPDGEKCAEMLLKSGADVNSAQENGETALHIACRHGNLKMVQALLADDADPAWQSKNGETPLHIAVRYCHWEVVDELANFVTKNKSKLDAVMLVNHQNQEGETAMHYAAELIKEQTHNEFEDTDLIKVLLDFDADINMQTRLTQESPLHYCARAGNADIMLEIVKHIGHNKTQLAVNKQSRNGWSPLLVASEQGHLDIVKILIKHNARVDVFDEHGKAALHLAAESGHEEVADVLLWHRAFVNAKSKLGVTPLHLACQNGYNKLVKVLVESHNAAIDALTLAKKTPLHMAAQNGQMEVCSTLLKMKADASATDVHGQTPLHLAAENDHSDVVKLFLKHRPELVTMANTNGMTCAHIAASKGSVAVVKELMRFNKVVVTTARNRTNDSTTLHLAAGGGHSEVVKVLLDAGASATDENADGMTAIHLAAKYGHINVLEALKDKVSWKVTSTKTGFTALHVAANYGQIEFCREILPKVPATVRSEAPHSGHDAAEYGLTPLHLAAQSGHEGLVRLLLNSPGVQADTATNVHGSIPLHLAAQSGHTAVVSLLLSKSTNQLHTKDKRGRTGLHLAAANGHLDMVSLLLGQGADIDVFDKNGWTPCHFAAKAGHLPVVKLLVEGGANPKYETKDGKVPMCFAAAANHPDVLSYMMKKDHDTHSLMEDNKFVFDLMVVGKNNNHSSIQEFVLTSPAPVETAVKMAKHFGFLSVKEKERSRDLTIAASFCEGMGTELNAIASSLNNAGALLKSVDNRGVPFLDVLIECETKEVVSHPSVQKYLSEVWMGHLSHWPGWKMIMLFCALLFIPPVWLAISLPFKHRLNKVPVIKFMSYLVSHIYLILLLFICVVKPFVHIWDSAHLWPHWYEWILLAWLSGLLVSQLTNPEDRAGLGWIKVIIIVISAIGVTVHLLAAAFDGDDRLVCLYVRNQFFAFALLLCFVQMMDFLSFHHLFGPWAIIIRDLMKDLVRFLVILVIFMMGFCLNIAAAYQPVRAPPTGDNMVGDGEGGGGAGYQDPLVTFELLFFALFGLVEPENLPPAHRNPIWTLNLVKALFGIYLIVTLIVLINLLIAMMSDTYQRIQAQSDTEWKFGRAKLFRNMNKTSATPSPLNLLTKLFTYCKILYKHRCKVCSLNAQQFVDEEEDLDVGSDTRSDMMSAGQAGWLRSVVRRGTQVNPDAHGDFLRVAAGIHRGPVLIQDVLDWKQVVDKYLQMQGMGEGGKEVTTFEDFGENEDKSNDIAAKENFGMV